MTGPRVSCVWREVGTADLICLDPGPHDCPLRPRLADRCTITSPHTCTLGRHRMASRPSRIPWRAIRDAALGGWVMAWLVVGLYALLVAG